MLTSPALIAQLAVLETRAVAAHALAEALGAEELIVFVRDPDLAVLLPAPGFAHTIRGGAEWRTFLAACVARGSATGRMFAPGRDADLEAWGYRIAHGGVLVLLGGAPDPSKVNEILPLFSLVTAIAGRESELLALDARRRIADTTAAQGEVLARALEQSRDQIRDALTSARESRRRIEEQAEALAAAAEELAQSRTELEALNEELVRANVALQHSVADAERARSSAEEANHAKSGFLAMMSHDLFLEQPRVPADRVQRRAQFVTHHGQKPGLGMIGLFGRRARAFGVGHTVLKRRVGSDELLVQRFELRA